MAPPIPAHTSRNPSGKFANLLQQLVILPAILDWLGEAALTSDRTQQAARADAIKKLQARYDQIDARIATMDMDKLDDRITREFFDKQAATLRREQNGLLCKIQEIQKAALAPLDHRYASPHEPGERVVPTTARR
jgi:hypothetical protein